MARYPGNSLKNTLRLVSAVALLASPEIAVAQSTPPATSQSVQGLDADWDGTLDAGGAKLRLVLHVHSAAGGGTVATLDSVDQKVEGLAVTALNRTGDKMGFQIPIVGARYDGTLAADGQSIKGWWVQGASLPLTFNRRAPGAAAPVAAAAPKRPQMPQPPFPYRTEEVSFTDDGAKLAGTLLLPPGKPVATVVLIAGSGPQTRDEEVAGHKIFLVLADYLARHDIAVLRYDKRGIGASTGDFLHATSMDFAADAEAAVAYLHSRPDIDPRHIGLIGHSEGGLVAPIVAGKDPRIAFVVLMAGPGENGLKLLLEQGDLIMKADGASDQTIATSHTIRESLFEAIRDEPDQQKRDARLRAIIEATPAAKNMTPAAIDGQIRTISTDWFRNFFSYDPVPALSKIRAPVLAIGGSLDLQVPAKENLAAIRAALASNKHVTVTELPGLNHLFQPAKTGSPAEYGAIEQTIAPEALTMITDWVVKQAGR